MFSSAAKERKKAAEITSETSGTSESTSTSLSPLASSSLVFDDADYGLHRAHKADVDSKYGHGAGANFEAPAEPGQLRATAGDLDLKDVSGLSTYLETPVPLRFSTSKADSDKGQSGLAKDPAARYPVYHKGNPYNYLALYRKHSTGAEATLVERRRVLDEAYVAYCRQAGEAILPECL